MVSNATLDLLKKYSVHMTPEGRCMNVPFDLLCDIIKEILASETMSTQVAGELLDMYVNYQD